MTIITLYRPDGGSLEYDAVTDAKIDGSVLRFYQQPDAGSITRKRIHTSLPFLIEEDVPALF